CSGRWSERGCTIGKDGVTRRSRITGWLRRSGGVPTQNCNRWCARRALPSNDWAMSGRGRRFRLPNRGSGSPVPRAVERPRRNAAFARLIREVTALDVTATPITRRMLHAITLLIAGAPSMVRTVRTVHAARLRRSLARAAHTSVFALAACGGGGDAPAGPPAPPTTPTPTVAVQVAPGQLTLAPGTIDAVTVSITRTNVTGAVTLSLSGLPAGVSAPSVSSSAATEAIPLTATSATAIAAATVTVTASAAGAPNASATFSLVVPALPAPAIRYPAC